MIELRCIMEAETGDDSVTNSYSRKFPQEHITKEDLRDFFKRVELEFTGEDIDKQDDE